MYKLFRTPTHHLGASAEPDYLLFEGKLFPTATHPRGWSEKADYELRADGKIYRCPDHPLGAGSLPNLRNRRGLSPLSHQRPSGRQDRSAGLRAERTFPLRSGPFWTARRLCLPDCPVEVCRVPVIRKDLGAPGCACQHPAHFDELHQG